MIATDIDRAWFSANPSRAYRLRRQTVAELPEWPVLPRSSFTGWCIIRRSDGAMQLFAFVEGQHWCDCDPCLECFFADFEAAA